MSVGTGNLQVSGERLKRILEFAEKLSSIFKPPSFAFKLSIEEARTTFTLYYYTTTSDLQRERLVKGMELLSGHLIGKIVLTEEQKKMPETELAEKFLAEEVKEQTDEPTVETVIVNRKHITITARI